MLAALVGCHAEPESPPSPPAPLPRVVSLSATASEMILELDAGRALIAVDSASRDRTGLAALPVVDLAAAVDLSPDLLVVPALAEPDRPLAERLRARGGEVIEFAPHDFDDAYALCRVLGLRLGRETTAHMYVLDHSRELALMSAAAFGFQRPRVAAVVSLSPFEVAGGHSFLTDLIEIAGAESVTHGNDDPRLAMSAAELLATAPDLVLVTSPTPLPETQRRSLRAMLGDGPELAFLAFDPREFWLHDADSIARELRALVHPLVRGPLRDMARSGLAP